MARVSERDRAGSLPHEVLARGDALEVVLPLVKDLLEGDK
jgi:hypothetical protein